MKRIAQIALAASFALALPAVGDARGDVPARCSLDRSTGTTIDAALVVSGGYGADWSETTDRIAFMKPDVGGFYRVLTMWPNGNDVRAVDVGLPQIPRKHQGTPMWHPSGRWIMFAAQKRAWTGPTLFGIPDYEALPGFGRHDDLWIAATDGSRAVQLTDEPDTKDQGILIPVFSADGKRVAWSDRQVGGTYELRVADFIQTPVPHLEHIRSYTPGGLAYYETGSFSSDGTRLAYTSDQDTHSFWRSQIYALDLATGKSTRLTTGSDYNEHPVTVSTPSGDWIVYMSSRGVDRYPGHLLLGTDWWAMRDDGSGTKRLTVMNVNRPNNPENDGKMQVAGRVGVTPQADVFLGDVQDSLIKQTGSVKRIRLVCK
ncbi:MAG: PD40 domain-containing protein [Candidatus Eremiobacteraeota bacterium]|nr:PD40 domain-containing protein [Candidatus Eremiobacteraeota bacterium]